MIIPCTARRVQEPPKNGAFRRQEGDMHRKSLRQSKTGRLMSLPVLLRSEAGIDSVDRLFVFLFSKGDLLFLCHLHVVIDRTEHDKKHILSVAQYL